MKTQLLLLALCLFIFSSCKEEVEELAGDATIQEIMNNLNNNWSLKDNQEVIKELIKDSNLDIVNYNESSDTVSFDRFLTDDEIISANAIALRIAEEYDFKSNTTWATNFYDKFHANDQLYVTHCQSHATPYTMPSIDGVERVINFDSGFIIEEDGQVYKTGFDSYWSACRYLTSDMVGKEYNQHLIDNAQELNFPIKFKKTGGVSGNGRMQSLNASMIGDFCARSFRAVDNLDTLGLCD
ncbi:MAG: hypothetical protein ACI9QD_000414 [Thermoproteota archaeon]|jgi:hypothetical protein